jgi:hypothetical protein
VEDRSFADQVGYVVGDAQAGGVDGFGSHSTGYGRREGGVNRVEPGSSLWRILRRIPFGQTFYAALRIQSFRKILRDKTAQDDNASGSG